MPWPLLVFTLGDPPFSLVVFTTPSFLADWSSSLSPASWRTGPSCLEAPAASAAPPPGAQVCPCHTVEPAVYSVHQCTVYTSVWQCTANSSLKRCTVYICVHCTAVYINIQYSTSVLSRVPQFKELQLCTVYNFIVYSSVQCTPV